MKYFSLIVFLILLSCGKKEKMELAKANVSVVKNVDDLSPIYLFFRTKEKDTLVEVNTNSSIITTNWIINVDKRLPLRIAIPEIMKLQEKKRKEKAHKNELAQNYYSYADSIGKNLAFLPFTNVFYTLGKPKLGVVVYFGKNNTILVDDIVVKKEELQLYLNNLPDQKAHLITYCIDKNSSFDTYIKSKIVVRGLVFSNKLVEFNSNQEYIY